MITSSRRARRAPPTYQRLSVKDWQAGKVSTRDANRTPENGLKTSRNTILKQDGTAADRPSTVRYGVQPIGTVLGAITEFTRRVSNVSQNYEISMQVVSGVAQIYYRKDGGSWTLAPGKTFDTSASTRFVPIRDVDADYNDEDKVLILNDTDFLAYLDINTLTVVPFTALSSLIAPIVAAGAGITGTNFNNYYAVTAGNRGETAGSPSTNLQSNKLRSEWSGATEYIDVTATLITGATKYHFYYGSDPTNLTYLTSVDAPTSGTTVTFRDTGVIDPNTFRAVPKGDTTAGPICGDGNFIDGQVFLVRDRNNPKYVRYGGTGLSILDFSPYGGGGYEPVGGNKEIPVAVKPFRKNDGTPAISVLCSGTNGFGKRYTFSPATIGSISYFSITEENGNDGTEAPDSVIIAKDQLWYLSRDGGKTTLTKAQVQTILSTEGVTDNIQQDISRFNTVTLPLSVGVFWENRMYWAVAIGTPRNNQIWVLDMNNARRGAWMLPWELAADWLWIYNDNSGKSHFCILHNNLVLEFTESVGTQDDGVAFPTGLGGGILKFSEDGREWGEVATVTFVLDSPQGQINVGVTAKTEDGSVLPVASQPFTAETSVAGWSEGAWGSRAWSAIGRVPQTFGIERTEIVLEIGQEVNWLTWDLTTQNANVHYELTDVIVEYINTGVKDS